MSEGTFLPASFLCYLWLCGLYHPPAFVPAPGTSHVRASCLRGWSRFRSMFGYAMAILSCTLTITGISDYIYYWEYTFTGTSDFFMWIRQVNYTSQVILTPVIVAIMFLSRKSIVALLHQFVRADSLMRFRGQWFLAVFAPLWIISWLALFCFCGSFRYWPSITGPLEAYWNSTTKVIDYGDQTFNIPVVLLDVIILTRSYYGVAVNVDMSSQLLYVLLIFGLAKGFSSIVHEIQDTVGDNREKSDEQLSKVLQKAFKNLRVLQALTYELNETFGFMILLNCIRDMICVVALISSLLQVSPELDHPETDQQRSGREESVKRQYYWDFNTIITLANAALRIGVCIYSSTNVQKIHRLVQAARNEYQGTRVEADCARILSEMDASTGAISAAGIKFINLDYVVEVVGIWITYGILIFQTRDDNARDLPHAKMKDLDRVMAYLKDVAQNESAVLFRFIQRRLNSTK